jgi:predicted small secreted protein
VRTADVKNIEAKNGKIKIIKDKVEQHIVTKDKAGNKIETTPIKKEFHFQEDAELYAEKALKQKQFAEKQREEVEGKWVEVKNKNNKKSKGMITSLMTVMPAGVNTIGATDWEEIDMAVDSGASETVVNEEMITNVETEPGAASKRGVQYEVASGELIPNLGEKNFVAVGESGIRRKMKAQVCDVNKALLSVARMVEAGNRVVFEKQEGGKAGGYVEDTQTGERMYMKEANGMFMLKLWVKKSF